MVGLFIKKTMQVMKLDHQIRDSSPTKVVMEEAGLLLNEKLPFQANTEVMIVNLTNKAKKYQREIENQWDKHGQERGEMLPATQESVSKYAKQTSDLQTTQLLEKEKLVSNFQQQREAVRDISLGREEEYRELHTIQEELKKDRAETAAKAQARYFQEKALLERQLNKPAMRMMGEREE